MKVEEIMTRAVVTTRPDAVVHEAARTMAEHRVSGLPVVDGEGRVMGVLSEGDLILRHKPRGREPWWRLFFADGERLARDYQKAMGITVGEVMTRSAICVSPDLPIESAAVLLDQHRVRRLPVVAGGRLVGIVSRGDLVRALAAAPPPAGGAVGDAELIRVMRERMAQEPWVSTRGILVQAEAGVVRLWGLVESEAEASALETMARALTGVRGVDSRLTVKSEIPYYYGI